MEHRLQTDVSSQQPPRASKWLAQSTKRRARDLSWKADCYAKSVFIDNCTFPLRSPVKNPTQKKTLTSKDYLKLHGELYVQAKRRIEQPL
jgi:hypothetical protein